MGEWGSQKATSPALGDGAISALRHLFRQTRPRYILSGMLDALFGGNSGNKKQQHDELQALVTQAREERAALSAMLTQMAGGTAKLAQTSKALDQVGQKADLALKRLEELGQKVTGYDERAKGLEQIEKRVAQVFDQVADAHRVAEKITAPDGELQKHRLAVNQLASQA
ncbi:MAG: hypothetical protein Q8N52_02705, partial [Acidobacteriota bacterium]|nr:hypothetical protein [Acidobacteriota bacterium]